MNKIGLHRETLRTLASNALGQAAGGRQTVTTHSINDPMCPPNDLSVEPSASSVFDTCHDTVPPPGL